MASLQRFESAASAGKGLNLLSHAFKSKEEDCGRRSERVSDVNERSFNADGLGSGPAEAGERSFNAGRTLHRSEKTRSFSSAVPAEQVEHGRAAAESKREPGSVLGQAAQRIARRSSSNVEKLHFSPSLPAMSEPPDRSGNKPSPILRHASSTGVPSETKPGGVAQFGRRLRTKQSSDSTNASGSPLKHNRVVFIGEDRDASKVGMSTPPVGATPSIKSQAVIDAARSSERRRRKQISENNNQSGSRLARRSSSIRFEEDSFYEPQVSLKGQETFDEPSSILMSSRRPTSGRLGRVSLGEPVKEVEPGEKQNSSILRRHSSWLASPSKPRVSLPGEEQPPTARPTPKSFIQNSPVETHPSLLRRMSSSHSPSKNDRARKEPSLVKRASFKQEADEADKDKSFHVIPSSPGDVGRQAPKPRPSDVDDTPRRLRRSFKSAPIMVQPENDPTKERFSARFRSGKSEVAERFINIAASSAVSATSTRELLKQSLVGTPARLQRRPSQVERRKAKLERIQNNLDIPRQLRSLCQEEGGLLKTDLRRIAWPCVLADLNRRLPRDELLNTNENVERKEEAPGDRPQDHHQIDLDCDRKYEVGEEHLRARLKRFLHAYFYAHSELSYFQGFHDLCGAVLRIFDDDLVADFVMYKISTLTIVCDAHRPTMDAVFSELKGVFYIIQCADPELAERVETAVGDNSFWGISMLTCLFAHDIVHPPTLERILDACIASGPHLPLYLVAALAMIPSTRRKLMTCELDETTVLGTLREDAREITDADELVRFALVLERRVAPSKVIDFLYRKASLPLDSSLASRWLIKSKWMFGSSLRVRDKPLGGE